MLGVCFGSGSLTWFRRPRLASPVSDTEVEASHPLVGPTSLPARPGVSDGRSALPVAAGDGPGRLPVGVPGGDGVALVIGLAPPGQGQLDLGPAVAEVQREGNERERLLLGPTRELIDLLAVEQQLPGPVGVVAAEALGE